MKITYKVFRLIFIAIALMSLIIFLLQRLLSYKKFCLQHENQRTQPYSHLDKHRLVEIQDLSELL